MSTLLFGALHPLAADDGEIKRFALMRETVQTKSIEEFMAAVHENKWAMPRIPSKWHVEKRVKDEEEKQRLRAACDLGFQMALRLPEFGQNQTLETSKQLLFEQSLMLCDLSDWCASTVVYGNFFLARECLVLASIGLCRLTADMDFPIDKCQKLAFRLNPQWLGQSRLLHVLNNEAGAMIFTDEKLPKETSLREF